MSSLIKVILCIICIISIVLQTTTENAAPCFQNGKIVRDLNSTKISKIETENESSSKLELLKVILNTMQNLSEKEIISLINLLNSEQSKEDGNKTEENSSTIESLNRENISERTLPIVITNSSVIVEKSETNDKESIKKDENTTINLDLKKSDVNNFTELEKNSKNNITEIINDDNIQKFTETIKSTNKEKRQIYNKNYEGEIKNEDVFLKAYKNCKLLVGERILRMGDQDPEKIRKCVFEELQKLESYDGEYTKLLDNSKIIRKL